MPKQSGRSLAVIRILQRLQRGAKLHLPRWHCPDERPEHFRNDQKGSRRWHSTLLPFLYRGRIQVRGNAMRPELVEEAADIGVRIAAILRHLHHVHNGEHEGTACLERLPKMCTLDRIRGNAADGAMVEVDEWVPDGNPHPTVWQKIQHYFHTAFHTGTDLLRSVLVLVRGPPCEKPPRPRVRIAAPSCSGRLDFNQRPLA